MYMQYSNSILRGLFPEMRKNTLLLLRVCVCGGGGGGGLSSP